LAGVMDRERLRIALVSDVYYPHVGGIQEHIYHLGLELKSKGHKVKVITGGSRADVSPSGLDVIRIGKVIQIPANKSFSKITVVRGVVNKLRRIFAREKFDVVHVHGIFAPILPLYSHLVSKAVTIHTFHAAFDSSIGYNFFKKLLQKLIKKVDGIIAVSNTARDSIAKYIPTNYTIIPNGVDTRRFNPENKKIKKFSDKNPIILFVGRFEPRKGLKYLFLSFNQIIKKIPDAILVVVGKGRLKEYYRSFLSKEAVGNVFFEGKVSMEALPSYFTTCDVFCSPAYTGESFGIILLEALASGKPVVASDIPGYRNIINSGSNGLLVEPKNPEEITKGILKILEDKKLERRFIEKGLETAEKYSWKNIARMIEVFYYNVLKEKSKSE
jgi:phosphatidylinositol alpha-mannosyltransferase